MAQLKAQELRIGNLFNIIDRSNAVHLPSNTIHQIGGIGLFYVYIYKSDAPIVSQFLCSHVRISDLSPIPLTEEWLLNFGFTREEKAPTKEHSNYYSKAVMDYKYSFAYAPFREDWGFYHSYTDANDEKDNNRFDFISCGIRHVHQIQNLFYALTGKELTINHTQK